MRVLVLGGSVFLGRHLVEAALARGDEVTVFTRGRTQPDLHPEATHLVGDRKRDLAALEHGSWDVVVDTSGFVPRVVRASAQALAGRVERYVFVSSISVYLEEERVGITEEAPVRPLPAKETEDVETWYGELKAASEEAVSSELPGRDLIVRPGLIVGPYDPTERFTYWVRRLARGGDVLVPGPPERLTQFIDARDLAEWLLSFSEAGGTGVFNATGPTLRLLDLLERARRVVGVEARFVELDEDELLRAGVEPWTELPLWLPGPAADAQATVDSSRAIAAGLSFRSVETTVRDTLGWVNELGKGGPPRQADGRYRVHSLDPARERELLTRAAE